MVPFLILLIIVIFLVIGWYFSEQVINIPTQPVEETYQIEVEAGKIIPADFETLPKEEIWFQSPFGYRLYGLFIPTKNALGTVVIAHGVTFSLYGSVKYMHMFRRRGWNVLLYDHRDHGRSGGKLKTYGFYEKYDLKVVVEWARTRGGQVAVMGESYGAATALQAASLLPDLTFIISDCTFSDLLALLAYHLKHDFCLPAFPLYQLASLITWLRAGFFLGQIKPREKLKSVKIPILFTHGADDDFTPAWMSQELFNAYEGPKQIYLTPGANHAEAYWSNPDEYECQVGSFLDDIQAKKTPPFSRGQ